MIGRVSFFVHDLAGNPIVRAAALARAVQRRYDVEIIGFLHSGPEVYEPYRDLFVYKTMRVPIDTFAVIRAIPSLAALATGDIVYACKPLMTSFVPALYAARSAGGRPLMLDIEDDEWVTPRVGWPAFLWQDVIKGWRHATAWKFTRALHVAASSVDATTVSTRYLQRRYGGTIVRHGPSEAEYDPGRPEFADRAACRRRWNLPERAPLALFAGVPRPHKGFQILVDALIRQEALAWHVVVAGSPADSDFAAAATVLGPRFHHVGLQPNSRMPDLLAAVDAVPVPQLDVAFARSQLPAKVLDAMAMARPVIASRVGDLPEILGEGDRGWLVPPGDSLALAVAMAEVAGRPERAQRCGRAARSWFLDEASQSANELREVALIEGVLNVRRKGRLRVSA